MNEIQSNLENTPIINTSASVRSPYFLGPNIDWLMMGGLSIIFFVLAFVFIDKSSSTTTLSWTMFYFALLVNNPHFMASYQIFYGSYRKKIVKNFKFFWVAFIVPLLLLGGLIYGAIAVDLRFPRLLINTMFFLVGWHYTKQSYGCLMMSSYIQNFKWTNMEKRVLRINLYTFWAGSYVGASLTEDWFQNNGLKYQNLFLPEYVMTITYSLMGLSTIAVIWIILKKYIDGAKWPPLSGILAVVALYLWFTPETYHSGYFIMIPFFHSIQYMLFIWTYNKNRAQIEGRHDEARKYRINILKGNIIPYAVAILLGLILFRWIPIPLDQSIKLDPLMGVSYFVLSFELIINVHHYFIDNLIWRHDNPNIKKFILMSVT